MLSTFSRPDVSAADLPALPILRQEALVTQIFTHRSVHARPTHIFEDAADDPAPDNEMCVYYVASCHMHRCLLTIRHMS